MDQRRGPGQKEHGEWPSDCRWSMNAVGAVEGTHGPPQELVESARKKWIE